MFITSSITIRQLVHLLQQLQNTAHYSQPIKSLGDSTIGQHVRHIIELYQCLLKGYESGAVNYDKRDRNKQIETDISTAIIALKKINETLEKENKELEMIYETETMPLRLTSNYFREVYYNLEHCIHHQALIKVGLIEMKINTIPDQFGVAPSTIQYRKQCAH